MSDGTVLRVDVYFPTNTQTGAAAPGPFPVILTQTPYGKGSSSTSFRAASSWPGSAATAPIWSSADTST
jgi:predicted acyl esterase